MSLKVCGYWSKLNHLEQLLALPLPLQQLQLDFGPYQLCGVREISISHLTALTELSAPDWGDVLTLQLPMQLQTLQLGAPYSDQFDALSRLQQLRCLSIGVVDPEKEPLLHLAQLPALQELSLRYDTGDVVAAAATAPVWCKLPQLRGLFVGYESSSVTDRQLAKITSGLAAATGLTKLQLTGESCHHGEEPMYAHSESESETALEQYAYPCSLCRSLARLTRLRDLSIATGLRAPEMSSGCWLRAEGVQALTALTELTRLVLVNRDGRFQHWPGDRDVVALVSGMAAAQLRELELEYFDTYSAQCMATISRMTQLTRLWLPGSEQWQDDASQRELLLLSGLSSLRRLLLYSVEEVADGVMKGLRASLPQAGVWWRKWVDEFEEWRRNSESECGSDWRSE
jgi:hypothetical protein